LRQARALENVQEQLKCIANRVDRAADRVDNAADRVIKTFGQMVTSLEQEVQSKKLERQDMPSKPAIFFGRDELVEKTSRLLASSGTALHMCLLGPGGMGKTSLALAIIESPLVQAKFQAQRRVWVPCIEAISASLFMQVLCTSLGITGQTDVMSAILNELTTSTDPYLLLLDNFETPWNGDGQKQVEGALRKLNRLSHVSILVTMRATYPPTRDVKWHSETIAETDKTACKQICQSINPQWDTDPNVDALLHAVGYMPFAVTLMASRGFESQFPAKKLLDEWEKEGPNMLGNDRSADSEISMNKSISLSVDSELVKDDPNALDVLATLSMLPAGTTTERMVHWAPDLKSMSSAIATLSKAALLQIASRDGNQTLFVLPVVQSFMLHCNRIPKHVQQRVRSAFCKYVLDHACRYRNSTFKANAEALAREDVNIQSILVAATNHTGSDDQLVQALLAFSWYRRDTKPLIAVAEHTLNVAKANGNKRYIAEASLCLGSSYAEVDNYVESKGLLEESSRLLVGDPSGQQLGFECALTRAHVGGFLYDRYEEREAIIKDVLIQTKDSDTYWHARALEALGWLYWYKGEYNNALGAFVPAADALLLPGCNRDVASALYGKARALDELYVPDEQVLEAAQEVWETVKHLDPSPIYGDILLLSGTVLLRMGRMVDASHSFERCLSAQQHVGAILGTADALSWFGHMYLHTGAYLDAYSAFEAAVEKYADLGDESPDRQMFEPKCRKNMENIKLKQENPDLSIGFYRPRCDRDWRRGPFYPPEVPSHP